MPCLLLEELPEMHAAAAEAGYNFKLHCFPRDSDRRNQWYSELKSLSITYPEHGSSEEICSLHFKPLDFEAGSLRPNAIPSVFTTLRRTELWSLNRKLTNVARCCVAGCHTTVSFNLYPFVSKFDERDFRGLARKRYRLWVRTLQVEPCESRPEVWICRRHFVNGFPAKLGDFRSVDWIPTLYLEEIPGNRCRECSVVVEKLRVEVPATVDEDRDPDLEAQFCRLCLVQNVPLQWMFLDSSAGQQLVELIERFTSIKIDFRQESNGSVCFKCLENLAQMEKMDQIKSLWNAKNDLLERLRANNNLPKEDPEVQDDVEPPPVVSIPIDTLITSIIEAPPKEEVEDEDPHYLDYDDCKPDLDPANISQDCVIVEPPPAEIVDLTDIEEREYLINLALNNLRRQMKPRKRKRSKTSSTSQDQPSSRKPCRNTRIG